MDLWEGICFHKLLCWGLACPPLPKSPWFFSCILPFPRSSHVTNFQSSRVQPASHTSQPVAIAQMWTPPSCCCLGPDVNSPHVSVSWGCVLPGRPFAVELVNPHRVHFTSQEIKELQQVSHLMSWNSLCSHHFVFKLELLIVFPFLLPQKINKSSNKIQVRDLQLVTR